MRRLALAGAVAAVVLNGAALVVLRGTFGHWFVVLGLAVYVSVPAALVVAGGYALRNRFRFASRVARIAALVAIVSASTLFSLIPGRELAKRDIAAAKAYCEMLAGRVEREKQIRGVYPRDLSAIRRRGEGPLLVRYSLEYWSDGVDYQFTFSHRRGIMRFISYNGVARRWHEWH